MSMFTHFVVVLGVAARGADILSTRLVTPTLALEGNALMRQLGWRGAWATLAFGLIGYWSVQLGVMLITGSLLVAGSNLGRGWFARFLGEHETERLMLVAVRRGTLRVAVSFVCAAGACIAAPAVLLMWLSGPTQWGFHFGAGILAYALAIAIHGSSAVCRLFRKAALVEQPGT
jgi:hypothetical protein